MDLFEQYRDLLSTHFKRPFTIIDSSDNTVVYECVTYEGLPAKVSKTMEEVVRLLEEHNNPKPKTKRKPKLKESSDE